MTKLSPHAKACLDTLSEKQLAFTIARATIEAELKQEFNERISFFKNERDMAMRLADEAGVPRTQLGKAIGTTNYRTVQELLSETESSASKTVQTNAKYSLTTTQKNNTDWVLHLFDVGPGSVSGSATVRELNGELVLVEGDAFVIPQAYRNGYAQEIVDKIAWRD